MLLGPLPKIKKCIYVAQVWDGHANMEPNQFEPDIWRKNAVESALDPCVKFSCQLGHFDPCFTNARFVGSSICIEFCSLEGGREEGLLVSKTMSSCTNLKPTKCWILPLLTTHWCQTPLFLLWFPFLNKKLLQESSPSSHPQEKNTKKKRKILLQQETTLLLCFCFA